MSLRTSFRLRGAGYRTYSNDNAPKGKHRRWLRHWLLAHSPSGLRPYPIDLWLTLPEGGCVDPYRMGRVVDFVKTRIAPRDFDPEKIDKLRVAYTDQYEDPITHCDAQEVFDRFREMGVLRPVTQEPSSAVIEEIVDHQTDDLNVNMVTIQRRPDQPRLKIDLQGGRLGSIIPVSKRAVVIGQEATQILR